MPCHMARCRPNPSAAKAPGAAGMSPADAPDGLFGGHLRLLQPDRGAHRAGMDAVLLAHLFDPPAGAKLCDVGAGTGFFLIKEGLQAYFAQQLLGPEGLTLNPIHLLYLATRAGAKALGLEDRIGDLGVGREFDATWLRPRPGSTFESVLARATDPIDSLAKIFTLATPADVAGVWVAGEQPAPFPTA